MHTLSYPTLLSYLTVDDAAAWAAQLGISREAIDLYLASEVVDLHVDSFIWSRVLAYDVLREHGRGLLGARIFSQVDVPRMQSARIGSALWSITTNPLRGERGPRTKHEGGTHE